MNMTSYCPYAVRSSNIRAKRFAGAPWGTWNWLHQKQKRKKKFSSYGNAWGNCIDLLYGLVSGGTCSPLASVLGLEQNRIAMQTSSTVDVGLYDTKYYCCRWHSSSFCMRHSWLAQFTAFNLNQSVELLGLVARTFNPKTPEKRLRTGDACTTFCRWWYRQCHGNLIPRQWENGPYDNAEITRSIISRSPRWPSGGLVVV